MILTLSKFVFLKTAWHNSHCFLSSSFTIATSFHVNIKLLGSWHPFAFPWFQSKQATFFFPPTYWSFHCVVCCFTCHLSFYIKRFRLFPHFFIVHFPSRSPSASCLRREEGWHIYHWIAASTSGKSISFEKIQRWILDQYSKDSDFHLNWINIVESRLLNQNLNCSSRLLSIHQWDSYLNLNLNPTNGHRRRAKAKSDGTARGKVVVPMRRQNVVRPKRKAGHHVFSWSTVKLEFNIV